MTDDSLELRTEYYRLRNISRENTDDKNSRKDMVYICVLNTMLKSDNVKQMMTKKNTDRLKNSMASNSKAFWKVTKTT